MSSDPQSAQQRAYAEIRELIVSGGFAPGSRLRERDVSAQLGLSRTPVREALQRLNSEGLVRSEHNRGVFVEDVDLSEMQEIFDVGAALESRCARLAARKISAEALARLSETVAEMRQWLETGKRQTHGRFLELDRQFHSILVEATGNRKLHSLVQQVISTPVLYKAFQHYDPATFARSVRQHEEILEAVTSGDEEWAEVAMRNHILAGRNSVMKRTAGPAGD